MSLLLQRDVPATPSAEKHVCIETTPTTEKQPLVQRDEPLFTETFSSAKRQPLLQRENPFCRERYL